MEASSSSDSLDLTGLPYVHLPDRDKDKVDGSLARLLQLKSRFYEQYGEHYKLKAFTMNLGDSAINTMLAEGKNTVRVIISDLNINDFKPTIPFFDQKRVVSEESLTRADRELYILERINSRIRRRVEELDQLLSFSI